MATASIFAKKDYTSQDGTVPLYMRLVINRKVHPPINLHNRTRPTDWDDALSRVKSSHPTAEKLNQYLSQQQRKADNVLLDHQLTGRSVTYESFCREFDGLSPYDFFFICEEYIKSIRQRKTEGYVKKVGFVIAKLKRFAPGLNLNQIDFAFVDRYMIYLQVDIGNSVNTVNSNIKILRRIFRHAIKLKLVKENPFCEVKLTHMKTERDSLSLEEFKKYEQLLSKDLPLYMRKVLVWFLLACCTGRRYEDLKTFYDWEFTTDYVKIVQMKRISGREERKINLLPLNDKIRSLVDIIRAERLTVIGPSSRKFLRMINDAIGQQKKISFHSGRHTFANINKELTSDLTIRRDLLGHDSIKSTLIYDHVNPKMLQEVMLKWNGL